MCSRRSGCLVRLALLVTAGLMAYLACAVRQVRLVLMVSAALTARTVALVPTRRSLALLGRLARMARTVRMGRLVQRVPTPPSRGRRVIPAPLVPLEHLVLPVPLGLPVRRVLTARTALTVSRGRTVVLSRLCSALSTGSVRTSSSTTMPELSSAASSRRVSLPRDLPSLTTK
jgi:hypothetical protein